jgi:hypothetical protein
MRVSRNHDERLYFTSWTLLRQSYHLNPQRPYFLLLFITVHVLKPVISIIIVCHYISVNNLNVYNTQRDVLNQDH